MSDERCKVVSSLSRPAPKLKFHSSQPLHIVDTTLRLSIPEEPLTLEYCERLVGILIDCPDLADFRRRVDPARDKAPDYYEKIKTPMDLAQLQERLLTGQVSTIEQFKNDLDLIWENCRLYNGEAHPVWLRAKEAKRLIDDVWKRAPRPEARVPVQAVEELYGLLTNLDKEYSALLALPPRPAIPPAKKPQKRVVVVKEKEPEVVKKPVDSVPNLQQRLLIADRMSKARFEEIRPAWELVKPFVEERERDSAVEKVILLNRLPDPVLIQLKKLVLT